MDATEGTTLPLLPLVLCRVPESLRNVLRQEGVPFVDRVPGAPAGRFVVFDSRFSARPALATGQTGIDVSGLRHQFEQDPFALLQNEELVCAQWQIGPVRVEQVVARIDKRAVRCRLLAALRRQIEQRGGIWLCISPFPFPFRSAINFRIDYDQLDDGEQHALLRATAGYDEATTHFLFDPRYDADSLQSFYGLDVGVGTREPWDRGGERSVIEQLREKADRLWKAGFNPRGLALLPGQQFSAPCGAAEGLMLQYVSGTAFAYDDLPWVAGPQALVHIPMYPICMEDFVYSLNESLPAVGKGSRRPDVVSEATAEHFRLVLQSHANSGDPLFLHAGCVGRRQLWSGALTQLLAAARQFDEVWRTTLSQFSAWWQQREQVHLTVFRQADRFVIACRNPASEFPVGIQYWRGEHTALMHLSNSLTEFSPAALAYERRPAAPRPAAVSIREFRASMGSCVRTGFRRVASPGINKGWRNWAWQAWQNWRRAS